MLHYLFCVLIAFISICIIGGIIYFLDFVMDYCLQIDKWDLGMFIVIIILSFIVGGFLYI